MITGARLLLADSPDAVAESLPASAWRNVNHCGVMIGTRALRFESLRERTASPDAGPQVAIAALAFLSVYAVCHLCHVAGFDAPIVARLIPIPLFAHAATGGAAALGALAVTRSPAVDARARFRWLPAAFAVGPALFTIGIILFP